MKHAVMAAIPAVIVTLIVLAVVNRLSPTNPVAKAING